MTLVAGSFRAKGLSGALGYTNDGKPQVAVELQILDEEFAGQSITWFGYFTEKTEERTLESLRTLGWKSDDLSDLDGITDNEVKIVVEEDEYQGKVRLKVQWINRSGGLALKAPMSPQQAKAFAASMKGKALASRSGGTTAAPSAQRPAAKTAQSRQAAPQAQNRRPTSDPPPRENTDDDIPF